MNQRKFERQLRLSIKNTVKTIRKGRGEPIIFGTANTLPYAEVLRVMPKNTPGIATKKKFIVLDGLFMVTGRFHGIENPRYPKVISYGISNYGPTCVMLENPTYTIREEPFKKFVKLLETMAKWAHYIVDEEWGRQKKINQESRRLLREYRTAWRILRAKYGDAYNTLVRVHGGLHPDDPCLDLQYFPRKNENLALFRRYMDAVLELHQGRRLSIGPSSGNRTLSDNEKKLICQLLKSRTTIQKMANTIEGKRIKNPNAEADAALYKVVQREVHRIRNKQ
jgi:hypothetical protein